MGEKGGKSEGGREGGKEGRRSVYGGRNEETEDGETKGRKDEGE